MISTRTTINNIVKKWSIILITSILFSVIFGYAKYIDNNYVIKSGPIWITKIVKIDNYELLTPRNSNSSFEYNKYMQSYSVIKKFLAQSSTNYDYEKFCLNWSKMTELEQYNWMQKHLFINTFGLGIYEICFKFENDDKKEIEYIKVKGEDYVKDYMEFSNLILKKYIGNASLISLDGVTIYTNQVKIDKKTIIKKHIIIGFICGLLVSVTILSVLELSKSRRKI